MKSNLVMLAILIFGLASYADDDCKHDAHNFRCVKLLDLYDGDTLRVQIPEVHPLLGERIGVRVNGVDTPEISTKDKCEKEAGRTAKKLAESLLKNAKRIDLENIKRDKYFRILADVRVEAKRSHGQRRLELEQRMAELDRFIQRAYEDKIRGDLDEEKWRGMDQAWKAEHAKILSEVGSLRDDKDEYMQRGVELIELMQHSEIIFKNATAEKKRKLVELVSSNLMLADGTLEYHWQKPFDLLAVKGNLENWRSQGDLNPCILREREVS